MNIPSTLNYEEISPFVNALSANLDVLKMLVQEFQTGSTVSLTKFLNDVSKQLHAATEDWDAVMQVSAKTAPVLPQVQEVTRVLEVTTGQQLVKVIDQTLQARGEAEHELIQNVLHAARKLTTIERIAVADVYRTLELPNEYENFLERVKILQREAGMENESIFRQVLDTEREVVRDLHQIEDDQIEDDGDEIPVIVPTRTRRGRRRDREESLEKSKQRAAQLLFQDAILDESLVSIGQAIIRQVDALLEEVKRNLRPNYAEEVSDTGVDACIPYGGAPMSEKLASIDEGMPAGQAAEMSQAVARLRSLLSTPALYKAWWRESLGQICGGTCTNR